MPDKAFTELVSDRLVLRRFRRSDAVLFAAYRTIPAVARFQGWDAPYFHCSARRALHPRPEWRTPTRPVPVPVRRHPRPDGDLLGDCGTGVSSMIRAR